MALYHVYARLATPPPAAPGAPTPTPPPNSRHLLTCASRYHADEYFRAFETPLRLKRISAQLWEYDPINSNVTLKQTLQDTTVDNSIRRGVMISQFPDTGATSLPEAPPQAGRDWISGRAYFIRNARQPEIYWFHPGCGDNRILASRWQKTKFLVRLSEAEEAETGTVLVRSDRVRITTASGVGEGKGMVVRKGDDSRMVVVKPSSVEAGNAEKDFRFRDLVGTFGTEWEVRDGVPNEYVTWGNPAEMHLDDWELC